MRTNGLGILASLAIALQACGAGQQVAEPEAEAIELWRGADLSYVNELEDCGAVYRKDGRSRDPYQIFAEAGTNVVRLRLWHSPQWTA